MNDTSAIVLFYLEVRRDLTIYVSALGVLALAATAIALLSRKSVALGLAAGLMLGAVGLGGAALNYIAGLPAKQANDIRAVQTDRMAAVTTLEARYSPLRTVPQFWRLMLIWAGIAVVISAVAIYIARPGMTGFAAAIVFLCLTTAILDLFAHIRDNQFRDYWSSQVTQG